MKKLIIFSILIFTGLQNVAGQNEIANIEHGVVFSPRLDSDDDFNFDIKGFGLETGYYFLKRLGKKGSISLDIRIAYSQSERDYKFNKNPFNYFTDSIRTLQTGTVNYRNFSLAIPIKYRYQLTEKSPIFLLVGFNPYFSLSDQTKWRFDETEFDSKNNIVLSETKDQKENLDQKFYSRDILLTGLGYKTSNFMFDIYFSGGSTFFNHAYIKGMDKLSLVFNIYYRIN